MDNARRLIKLIPPLFDTPYYRKMKRLFGSAVIGYWPLWDLSGSVATDISGSSRHGAYTGVDLNYPGIGDGKRSPYFDGTNDYVNIYSASLASAFNGGEGSVMVWLKPYNTGVWTDSAIRTLVNLTVDASNHIYLWKDSDNSFWWIYRAGGTDVAQAVVPTGDNYANWGMTWSKTNNRMRGYRWGAQYGSDVTGLGTWAGALSSTGCIIGALGLPSGVMYGYLAHGILLNREATAVEMAKVVKL